MNEQHSENSLTICAVYHSPETRALLDMNVAFVRRMNPGSDIRWLVSDNSPNATREMRTEGLVTIIKGAAAPADVPAWARGSYHHAAGLNLLMPYITTRFVLFLDVDFFLVLANWTTLIISHMRKKNLAIFGAPYHPRDHRKYRYFPCVYCLFLDGSQIKFIDLDFSPDMRTASLGRLRRWCMQKLPEKILGKRYSIRGSKDTGFKFYEKFYNKRGVCFEYVIPVWHVTRSLIEYVLPERWCLVPKRKSFISRKGFAEYGHTNLAALDGEEFVWNGGPFGFHIKSGTNKMKESTKEKTAFLNSVLAEFILPHT